MIKAVIFDLDGTLLNTLDGLKDSTNYALEKFNYPQRNNEEIRAFVGNGVKKLIERAIPGGAQNPQLEEVLAVFKDNYSQTMHLKTRPYDGILELLAALKEKNYKIAVLSNKFDAAVKTLCKEYFNNLIDLAIGESPLTPPKPDPKGTLNILKLLNCTKEETVFVGDSQVDVQTAKNAGLKCIGVSWGFRDTNTLKEAGADYIINTPKEILNLI